MTEEEFKLRMKELGWDDEYIEDCLKTRQKCLKTMGISVPLEAHLRPAPILNTSLPIGDYPEIY